MTLHMKCLLFNLVIVIGLGLCALGYDGHIANFVLYKMSWLLALAAAGNIIFRRKKWLIKRDRLIAEHLARPQLLRKWPPRLELLS